MRILIVDDSKRRVQIMHKFLVKEVPEIEAAHYSPEQRGKPQQSFDWSRFDAMLLDDELGGGQSGLQWLEEFAQEPGYPPTVLITSQTDTHVTTKALGLGARGVINKRDLTPASLAEAVRKAVAEQRSADNSSAGRRTANDADIIAQSRKGNGDGACDYKFVRLIGQGAMSRVYLAERVEDKVTVVLKIMDGSLSNEPESVTRFIQEASLVSQMRSPYVVKIFEQGFTNKYGFIAMEFFARGDLRQRIEHGTSPQDALIYLLNIAYGLESIHDAGIVHRDLKPENIMFRGDDGLALTDFGISKRIDDTSDLTVVGSVLGTPHYMSPEQGRSQPVDARSDLYSAGVILYELLTGKRPFDGDSLPAVIYQHLHGDIPELEGKLGVFQNILNRLLAKRCEDRFQSATALIAALELLGQSLGVALPTQGI
jgi:DNA-binding NarL/FixJ family response regulator/tRNA A-37 threonylcarbamoyl transferase component Bud32